MAEGQQQMEMPLEPNPEVKLNLWEQSDREKGWTPPEVRERLYVPLDQPATVGEQAAMLRRLRRLEQEADGLRDDLRKRGVPLPKQRTRIKQATNERLPALRDLLAGGQAEISPKEAGAALGVSADYAYDLLAALREAGEVERVRPGVYRLTPLGRELREPGR